jgi:hypothetical protein
MHYWVQLKKAAITSSKESLRAIRRSGKRVDVIFVKIKCMENAFSDCTLIYLEKTFALKQVNSSQGLKDWLELRKEMSISDFEREDILLYQDLLKDNILHWNEQELSLHFIGPLFSLVRFTSPERRYNLFAERLVSASVENISNELVQLSGKPDGLVASGYREPESPYFCFTEYKKHREPAGEPEAQCLASLLAGQVLNRPLDKDMYGCFVIGRDWYFMSLSEKEYCISQDFSAATDDVFEIFKILKALKEIVKQRTATL